VKRAPVAGAETQTQKTQMQTEAEAPDLQAQHFCEAAAATAAAVAVYPAAAVPTTPRTAAGVLPSVMLHSLQPPPIMMKAAQYDPAEEWASLQVFLNSLHSPALQQQPPRPW
jgi:hypothetical protein